MDRSLVVAAALVDDLSSPTRMLAARRSTPVELAGMWEFPGGKVDPGETPQVALHRELREELGVAAELGPEFHGPDGDAWIITERHRMRLWFARIVDGDPVPLVAHDELRWLTGSELSTVRWLPGDVRIVEALKSHLAPV